MLYIPVWVGLGLTFLLFGNKMINLVLYGTLLWVLLTCYPNVIKSELLSDTKYVFGDHRVPSLYDGVDRRSINSFTESLGSIYKNYGNDPIEKILVLACSVLACSQFFVTEEDYLFKFINKTFGFLMF